MVNLILRPSGNYKRPWSFQLRDHGPVETDYDNLCDVDDRTAEKIIKAGAPYWLFGEPDWEQHYATQEKLRLKAEIEEKQRRLKILEGK